MSEKLSRYSDLLESRYRAYNEGCFEDIGSSANVQATMLPESPTALTQHFETPIPQQLVRSIRQIRKFHFSGIFPEIHHVWWSVDERLWLWDYNTPDSIVQFDGFMDDHAILTVALVKPDPSIIDSTLVWLLVVVTEFQVGLLGIQYVEDQVYLVHIPITAPCDQVRMIKVIGTPSGRIFLGASDGHLYELQYQIPTGWMSSCYLRNHTRSLFYYLQPSFFGLFSRTYEIADMAFDKSRHLLYTLAVAENHEGLIRVYNVDSAGFGLSQHCAEVYVSPRGDIPMKALFAIEYSESVEASLVVVFQSGLRVYYGLYGPEGTHGRRQPRRPVCLYPDLSNPANLIEDGYNDMSTQLSNPSYVNLLEIRSIHENLRLPDSPECIFYSNGVFVFGYYTSDDGENGCLRVTYRQPAKQMPWPQHPSPGLHVIESCAPKCGKILAVNEAIAEKKWFHDLSIMNLEDDQVIQHFDLFAKRVFIILTTEKLITVQKETTLQKIQNIVESSNNPNTRVSQLSSSLNPVMATAGLFQLLLFSNDKANIMSILQHQAFASADVGASPVAASPSPVFDGLHLLLWRVLSPCWGAIDAWARYRMEERNNFENCRDMMMSVGRAGIVNRWSPVYPLSMHEVDRRCMTLSWSVTFFCLRDLIKLIDDVFNVRHPSAALMASSRTNAMNLNHQMELDYIRNELRTFIRRCQDCVYFLNFFSLHGIHLWLDSGLISANVDIEQAKLPALSKDQVNRFSLRDLIVTRRGELLISAIITDYVSKMDEDAPEVFELKSNCSSYYNDEKWHYNLGLQKLQRVKGLSASDRYAMLNAAMKEFRVSGSALDLNQPCQLCLDLNLYLYAVKICMIKFEWLVRDDYTQRRSVGVGGFISQERHNIEIFQKILKSILHPLKSMPLSEDRKTIPNEIIGTLDSFSDLFKFNLANEINMYRKLLLDDVLKDVIGSASDWFYQNWMQKKFFIEDFLLQNHFVGILSLKHRAEYYRINKLYFESANLYMEMFQQWEQWAVGEDATNIDTSMRAMEERRSYLESAVYMGEEYGRMFANRGLSSNLNLWKDILELYTLQIGLYQELWNRNITANRSNVYQKILSLPQIHEISQNNKLPDFMLWSLSVYSDPSVPDQIIRIIWESILNECPDVEAWRRRVMPLCNLRHNLFNVKSILELSLKFISFESDDPAISSVVQLLLDCGVEEKTVFYDILSLVETTSEKTRSIILALQALKEWRNRDLLSLKFERNRVISELQKVGIDKDSRVAAKINDEISMLSRLAP